MTRLPRSDFQITQSYQRRLIRKQSLSTIGEKYASHTSASSLGLSGFLFVRYPATRVPDGQRSPMVEVGPISQTTLWLLPELPGRIEVMPGSRSDTLRYD